MKWQLSIPSKTFLLGEYAVLKHGPALILNTEPRFKMLIQKPAPDLPLRFSSIGATSPAEKWLANHRIELINYQIEFQDPYFGLGGFGASTAHYGLLKAFFKPEHNHANLLADYQQYAWDGIGSMPSGVDLIGQLTGGLCYYNPRKNYLEILSWPFSEINFILVHTGHKLATHQHLKDSFSFSPESLIDCVEDAYQCLQQQNLVGFCAAINRYRDWLSKYQLVTPHTLKWLSKIQALPETLAAKGCGAMGADVILILAYTKQQTSLLAWLAKQGLTVVYAGQELQSGLKIEKVL